MTLKFSAALLFRRSPSSLSASAPASAQQTRLKYDRDGRVTYGPSGPNRSYQQGPRTRVYVTTRSWLDAGTEVLPGDRKFQDYAFPPEIGYPIVRAREPQPADRPPAAQSAVGSRRLSDAIPAVLITLIIYVDAVMAGHSRLKDGVASACLYPAIHVFGVAQERRGCPRQARA